MRRKHYNLNKYRWKANSSPWEINERHLIRKLQEFDQRLARGAAVGAEGEEKWREHIVFLWAPMLVVRGSGLPSHTGLPVYQKVTDPPTGGLRHAPLDYGKPRRPQTGPRMARQGHVQRAKPRHCRASLWPSWLSILDYFILEKSWEDHCVDARDV